MSNTQLATVKTAVQGYLPTMLKALPDDEETRFRFKQAALAVASIPYLANCDARSVVKCVYECARLNLIPDPVMQHVAIVPFKGQATIIPMYKGLLTLARRAEPQLFVDVGSVYANDDFDLIEGTETRLVIKRRWYIKGAETPGKVVLAYCISAMPGQSRRTVIVSRQEGEVLKGKSRGGTSSPWHEHFEAMLHKTAIRKSAKLWTLSPIERAARQLAEAVQIDESDSEDLPLPPLDDVADMMDSAAADAKPAAGEVNSGQLKSQAEASRRQAPPKKEPKPEAPAETIEELRAKLAKGVESCLAAINLKPDGKTYEAFARFFTKAFDSDAAADGMAKAGDTQLRHWIIMTEQLNAEQIKKIVEPFLDKPAETGFQSDMGQLEQQAKGPVPTFDGLLMTWCEKRKCKEAQARKGLEKLVTTMFEKDWVDLDADEARMVGARMATARFDFSKFDEG